MRALLALWLLLAMPARAQETEDALPPGEGRSETFGYCTPCHGVAVILRTRLTRPQWDALMDWMTEKQGMPPLEGELRRTIVDYLARTLAPAGRGARNPFLQ